VIVLEFVGKGKMKIDNVMYAIYSQIVQ